MIFKYLYCNFHQYPFLPSYLHLSINRIPLLRYLRYYVCHTILIPLFYIIDKFGDNCTNDIDCTTSFQHSTCSMNTCACITGYREVLDTGLSVCVKSESSDKFEYNMLIEHKYGTTGKNETFCFISY